MSSSRLISRNVLVGDLRTSMRLEPEVWEALSEICAREGVQMGDLVRAAEANFDGAARTSSVRAYALIYFRAAATEAGHRAAGHGRGG